jgi:nitroimidazol reductase NimA-like FMN-containing flavoprotein (pyridoxamine 5'-phosphate oxidase superfamily)
MESFLTDIHVAVISIAEVNRGPLTVPIWYTYEPAGELGLITFRSSRKARLLEVGTRFSLCVQDEAPPYKFVTVEGPVTEIRDAELERDIRPLARRYLGAEGGDRYVTDTYADPADPGELYVRMKPERWYS